jgi:hypothetical protein
MELKGLLPCSEEPATGSYPEPNESSVQFSSLLKTRFNIILPSVHMKDSRPRKLNSCCTAVVTPLPRYAARCTMPEIMKWLQAVVTVARGILCKTFSGQRDLLVASPCKYRQRVTVILLEVPTLRSEYTWSLSQGVGLRVHGEMSKHKTWFLCVPYACGIVTRNLVSAVTVFSCLLLKF